MKGDDVGSAENRAAVESAYEAFGRADIATVIAMNAPHTVWVNYSTPASPLNGEFKGLDGVSTFFGLVGEHIDMSEFTIAPIAADGDVVVSSGHQTYTVKRTGKVVSGPVLHIFTFDADGRVTNFEEWEADTHDAWT